MVSFFLVAMHCHTPLSPVLQPLIQPRMLTLEAMANQLMTNVKVSKIPEQKSHTVFFTTHASELCWKINPCVRGIGVFDAIPNCRVELCTCPGSKFSLLQQPWTAPTNKHAQSP